MPCCARFTALAMSARRSATGRRFSTGFGRGSSSSSCCSSRSSSAASRAAAPLLRSARLATAMSWGDARVARYDAIATTRTTAQTRGRSRCGSRSARLRARAAAACAACACARPPACAPARWPRRARRSRCGRLPPLSCSFLLPKCCPVSEAAPTPVMAALCGAGR